MPLLSEHRKRTCSGRQHGRHRWLPLVLLLLSRATELLLALVRREDTCWPVTTCCVRSGAISAACRHARSADGRHSEPGRTGIAAVYDFLTSFVRRPSPRGSRRR
jgi:hypothetical protein